MPPATSPAQSNGTSSSSSLPSRRLIPRGQTIRLTRRTYSPILRQASLPGTITVPWWDGRTLRYQYD